MSESAHTITLHIRNINICIGGVQIVNTGDSGKPNDLPLHDNPFYNSLNGAGPDSNGNNWFIDGQGNICSLTMTHVDAVPSGQKVRGRVYQGATNSTSDPGYDPNSTVDGITTDNGNTWTWTAGTNPLGGAVSSASGSANFVAFWIVNASDNTFLSFDSPLRNFTGIPSPYSSGSCGGSSSSGSVFSATMKLDFRILDGKLMGDYVVHQVLPTVWRISTRTGECFEFRAHGNSLTVRTPFGERAFSISRGRPFSIVLPGVLFGSSHNVVVSAP